MSEKMQIETPKANRGFDPEKVEEAFAQLVSVFQEQKLTVGEIIIAYGNLGYTLGASIEGYAGQGPSIEELEKLYYQNPTIGVSLMLQSIMVTTWFDDYMNNTDKLKEQK